MDLRRTVNSLRSAIDELYARTAKAPPASAGYQGADGPVTLSDLLDTVLASVTVTPATTGRFLLIANANCQNAPMGGGAHSFFVLLDDGSTALRTHPSLSVGVGESHAAVIQVETAGYPPGTPVTFNFKGRASGGSGTDMSAVAIDFSVTERA